MNANKKERIASLCLCVSRSDSITFMATSEKSLRQAAQTLSRKERRGAGVLIVVYGVKSGEGVNRKQCGMKGQEVERGGDRERDTRRQLFTGARPLSSFGRLRPDRGGNRAMSSCYAD